MSLSRFYLPPASWTGTDLTLSGDEAQHCARVLRHGEGDAVEIFDGQGRVATGIIVQMSKAEVRVVVSEEQVARRLPVATYLLPALIKPEPFEWLLEKAVELGATGILPVITSRTVVHLTAPLLEKKLAKWRRQVVESAKQCHTPFLPTLEAPKPLAQLIPQLPAQSLKLMPSLTERTSGLKDLLKQPQPANLKVFVLVGPEGDFTREEEALAQSSGFQPITLGPLVLRAETASLATLAVLQHELGDQVP